MKYSEKMQLLLKGVKMSEIADLEEQEAEELEADLENEGGPEGGNESDNTTEEETKKALQAALEAVKDLEGKLSAKEDELTKLNAQFAALNNKQTLKEVPEHKYDATDVFKELYHPVKKEV